MRAACTMCLDPGPYTTEFSVTVPMYTLAKEDNGSQCVVQTGELASLTCHRWPDMAHKTLIVRVCFA